MQKSLCSHLWAPDLIKQGSHCLAGLQGPTAQGQRAQGQAGAQGILDPGSMSLKATHSENGGFLCFDNQISL